jgi:vancomycin permeability regulator SanA
VAVTAAAGVPFGWVQAQASGHLHDLAGLREGAGPHADVVIVLGAQVAPGGVRPMPFLQYRLDTAAALVASGRAKVVLASGDASGTSGNEPAVMRDYLAGVGIDPDRVVMDLFGLDTYDSCVRARQVFGVTRALIVTQRYHLARAVTLCRQAGIDTDGVSAHCDGCSARLYLNAVREYFACTKAAWEAYRDRPAAVASPPSTAITDALARWR